MSELIFEDYGVILIRRSNKYFVSFDTGHFCIKNKEFEVSFEQAQRLQINEQEAHKVILETENSSHSSL